MTEMTGLAAEMEQHQKLSQMEDSDMKEEKDNNGNNDPNDFYTGDYVQEVGVFINCSAISHIDLVKQSFTCNLLVQFGWQATKEDHKRWFENKKEYIPSYTPKYIVQNAMNISREEIDIDYSVNNTGYTLVKEGDLDGWGLPVRNPRYKWLNSVTYKISGEFSEQFELQAYPVDCQDLQITIGSKESTKKVIYVPNLEAEIGTAEVELEYGDHIEYVFHHPIIEYMVGEYEEDCFYSNVTLRYIAN